MPGISFIYDTELDSAKYKESVLTKLDLITFSHSYDNKILLHERNYMLCCTKYEEYPLSSYENREYLIFLEGKLYGMRKQEVFEKLVELAELCFLKKEAMSERLTKWMKDVDGEFVLFIKDKQSGDLVILNDLMGHLPLYFVKEDSRLLVSREISFILALLDNKSFSKIALSQYLMFCHTLGSRTLYENVFRLEPAMMLCIRPSDSETTMTNYHQYNFERKDNSGRTSEENAHYLASLFTDACEKRAVTDEGYTNVLSLSGGLDSRGVGAGLKKRNVHFAGATFRNKSSAVDVEIAKKIAKSLSIDLRIIDLTPPKGKDHAALLAMKQGANYLGMAFILPFFETLLNIYGPRTIYFTGDMGTIIKDYSPSRDLKNMDDLINYILFKHSPMALNDVEQITGVRKEEIIEILRSRLSEYPETDYNQKYVHFQIYERVFNWGFEGVDRNRYYFWTGTPLLSSKVFDYSMNCPDEQKGFYRLYKHFLMELSPELAAIDYANYRFPITSKRLIVKHYTASFYVNNVPDKLRKIIRKYILGRPGTDIMNTPMMNCFREQISNCKSIDSYLSGKEIESRLSQFDKYDLNKLFTVSSLCEKELCKKSSIEKYIDSELE